MNLAKSKYTTTVHIFEVMSLQFLLNLRYAYFYIVGAAGHLYLSGHAPDKDF